MFSVILNSIWWFPEIGVPQFSSFFMGFFIMNRKPSILGILHLWTPPSVIYSDFLASCLDLPRAPNLSGPCVHALAVEVPQCPLTSGGGEEEEEEEKSDKIR